MYRRAGARAPTTSGGRGLERGIFEVEAHSRIPFAARGENLNVNLTYDLLGPRYRGTVAIQPLYLSYDDYGPTPFAVNLAVTMEKNRIALDSATIAMRFFSMVPARF